MGKSAMLKNTQTFMKAARRKMHKLVYGAIDIDLGPSGASKCVRAFNALEELIEVEVERLGRKAGEE